MISLYKKNDLNLRTEEHAMPYIFMIYYDFNL